MPYIKQEDRRSLDKHIDVAQTAGELNYVITSTIVEYLKPRASNYNTYNEVIGVLECVKQELYRRAVAPYEDQKIAENGDVY